MISQTAKATLSISFGILLLILAGFAPALAMETEDCEACHSDRDMVGDGAFIDSGAFAGTSHAEMGGCIVCHATVSDTHPDDGLSLEKATCGDCHEDVTQEYEMSSHGGFADCADCHDPHAVLGPTQVSGTDMNQSCASCHDFDDMVASHTEWLPQTALHMESLPCITCHTGSENYVITFYFTDSKREGAGDFRPLELERLREIAGSERIESIVDFNEDNYISLTELRNFHLASDKGELRLKGMMTPEEVTHSFEILDNRWDCSFCHASGPEAMQTSYLGFPRENGTISRIPVEQGAVLDTLFGTPDFYMMGATRSKALNIAGLLIIAGGLVLPVGHGALRFLTRKNRSGKEH